jgi:hypothetical protein
MKDVGLQSFHLGRMIWLASPPTVSPSPRRLHAPIFVYLLDSFHFLIALNYLGMMGTVDAQYFSSHKAAGNWGK